MRLLLVLLLGLALLGALALVGDPGEVAPARPGLASSQDVTAAPPGARVSGEAEGETAGGGEEALREDATRPPQPEEGDSPPELDTLTREEFVGRLLQLGIRPSSDLFDKSRTQRPDLGALLVLVSVDGEGAVVRGATVRLDPWTRDTQRALVGGAPSPQSERLRTGGDGVASRWNLDPGPYFLAVAHDHFLGRSLGVVEVAAGEPTFLEVTLERSEAVVAGIVLDEDGGPLPGALVTGQYHSEGSARQLVQCLSLPDGTFTLGVREGTQNQVTATLTGYHDAAVGNIPAGYTEVVLILEDADTATVRGYVTDGPGGDPVPAFSIDGEPFQHPGGVFEVERNVAPAVSLTFSAAEHQSVSLVVDLSDGKDVDLGEVPLAGGRELRGIVLLDGEEGPTPVNGANVSVTSAEDGAATGFTSPDGAFAFEGLSAEVVDLRVTAPDAAPHNSSVPLLEGEPTYVEVLLTRGEYTATGRVLDASTDEPIEGATVSVVEVPTSSTLTDAEGHYTLSGVPLASFSLLAEKSGFEPETSPLLDAEAAPASWDARLVASGLRLELEVGGAPVSAGVPVVLWRKVGPTLADALAAQADLANNRFEGATDEQGRVTFDVTPGPYFVQVPDYHLNPLPVTALESGADWVEVPLPGVTRLEGRIRMADGSPVAHTSFWLHSGNNDYATMILVHTDGGGRYEVPHLAPRPYALSIIKTPADQSAQHVREVQVTGAPSQTFDVTYPPLTATIRGRVVDELGQPRPGIQVGCEYLDASHRSILAGWVGTDPDGRFVLPRLEPGRHIVRTAWTEDEVVFSDIVQLTPGQELVVDLVQPRVQGRHARGHMLTGDGGPLGGNFVFARDAAGRQSGNYFSTMDWAYVGSFDVNGLHPGGYTLTLTAMGCVQRDVPVQVAGDVGGLVVTMARE